MIGRQRTIRPLVIILRNRTQGVVERIVVAIVVIPGALLMPRVVMLLVVLPLLIFVLVTLRERDTTHLRLLTPTPRSRL